MSDLIAKLRQLGKHILRHVWDEFDRETLFAREQTLKTAAREAADALEAMQKENERLHDDAAKKAALFQAFEALIAELEAEVSAYKEATKWERIHRYIWKGTNLDGLQTTAEHQVVAKCVASAIQQIVEKDDTPMTELPPDAEKALYDNLDELVLKEKDDEAGVAALESDDDT